MFKKVLLSVFFTLLLMSHNALAVDFVGTFKRSGVISQMSGDCQTYDNRIINNDPSGDPLYIHSFCVKTTLADSFVAGDYVTFSFILGNFRENNSLDARFRGLRGDNSYSDLVDVHSYNVGSSTAIIDLTLHYKSTFTNNVFPFYSVFGTNGVTLYQYEELMPYKYVVWNEADFSGGGVAPSGDTYSAVTYIHSQLDNIYFQQLTPLKNNVVTINGTTAQIRDLLLAQGSDLSDIKDNTQNVSDWADEQRQAYQNMQNTDGLIDIGNDNQALTVVGALNSLVGQISNIQSSAECMITGNLGFINLGNLNFCQGKENFQGIVNFVSKCLIVVVGWLVSYHCMKKIIATIDWARRN